MSVDGASETVKHKIKKQEGGFLPAMMGSMVASSIAPMTSSLIQPLTSSLITTITGKGIRRAGKGQGGFLPLLAARLLLKVYLEKQSWTNIFCPAPSFNKY